MTDSLVILKMGATLEEIARRRGDFEDWIAAGLGVRLESLRVVSVFSGAALPCVTKTRAVVVTGSPSMVTAREPWSVRSEAWLRDVWQQGRPILGICYGHQLLAQALGGRVAAIPGGREIGTVTIQRTEEGKRDPLLSALEDTFLVQESHSEAVVDLPPGAQLLATGTLSYLQSFRVGHAWGVQFHPEFDADIVRGYILGRAEALRSEGLDPHDLATNAKESDAGLRLLRRFSELALGGKVL